METVGAALRALACHPVDRLLRRWNWKSALVSSVCRALIFLAANLPAGRHAALRAMLTEFLFRAVAAGFYGALTQAFRSARLRAAGSRTGRGRRAVVREPGQCMAGRAGCRGVRRRDS
jgi:hypothetical protein